MAEFAFENRIWELDETLPRGELQALQVEVTAEVFTDKVRSLEVLQGKLEKALENTLGIRVDVRLVEPRTIQRSEGKAKRVLDQRNAGD